MPVGSGYAPYLRTGLVAEDLAVRINEVPSGAMFGEFVVVSIELIYHPRIDYGHLTDGVPIQLIEGTKVVAVGFCRSEMVSS